MKLKMTMTAVYDVGDDPVKLLDAYGTTVPGEMCVVDEANGPVELVAVLVEMADSDPPLATIEYTVEPVVP